MMLGNTSAFMPDKCVDWLMCGTYGPMWLNSKHPKLTDQVIQSTVCAAWSGSCCNWETNPIHVKACPGNYYVYKLESPPFCNLAYCATVNASQPTITPTTTTTKVPDTTTAANNLGHVLFNCGFSQCPDGQDCLNSNGVNQSCADPCSNYRVLDDAWRSTSSHVYVVGSHCDQYVAWQGWYRMMLGNTSAFMPDKCVDELMCGTYAPMWLNSKHPKLTDQVIQSTVCAAWSGSCCLWETKPIHVKACPGNYYVYKLESPPFCNLAYCARGKKLGRRRRAAVPPNNLTHVLFNCSFSQCPDGQDCLNSTGVNQSCADPCSNYQVLDDAWRSTSAHVYTVGVHCDYWVKWEGWYRMMLGNTSAFMPDKCVDWLMCGTHGPMWLNSEHPKLTDQIIQSTVCAVWKGSCCYAETKPIHVKACPGNYYVYKLQRPPGCNIAYCAGLGTSMMLGNTSASMPDKCVDELMCGTHAPMWLNSKHPKLTDQVIQSTACAAWSGSCCNWETKPIHVKACPGNYYVYKLKSPPTCYLAYCTNHPALPEPVLRCGESVMEVGLQVAKLQAIGLDAFSAHLSDPRCHDHAEINSTVWYRVERTETTCGNTLKTNGTHALYSNSLFVYPVLNVSFVRPLSVPFTCAYPLDGHSSLNIAVRPYLP
ncbi:uncharacterized protein FYW47_004679 [Aplochiton taeniatus]